MTKRGFIYLWRQIINEPFYSNPKVCRIAIHCLLKANFIDRDIEFNGCLLKVKRGSFITGVYSMTKETGLTSQVTRTSLKKLTNVNFLTIKSTNKYSIITICNYDTYQNKKTLINNQDNKQLTNKPENLTSKLTTTNKFNNIIDNNITPTPSPITSFDFKSIWGDYPKRLGRKTAERHFNASVKTEKDYADIQVALKNYLASERVSKGFIQNGSTWFNNWQDWVDYKEKPETNPNDKRPEPKYGRMK